MKCPFCRETITEVYNSRSTKSGNQIWRRRHCGSCGNNFTTYELIDLKFMRVINKSGKLEPYSRARLYSGIYQAFDDVRKRPDMIDNITETIESKILNLKEPVINSKDIAAIVLTTLKNFDTTAFLRYLASHTGPVGQAQLKREISKY